MFVESIVLLWRNVFSNVFFVVAFCYISKLFYCRLEAIALLFLLCVFLHRNCVVFSDFFAVTSTLKGKECWQTCCFPTLKNNFLRVNSLFCDEGLAWRLRSSKNCFERSRSWLFLLPNRAKIAFAERCVSLFLCPM